MVWSYSYLEIFCHILVHKLTILIFEINCKNNLCLLIDHFILHLEV